MYQRASPSECPVARGLWTTVGPHPSTAQGPNLGVYSSKGSSAPRHTAGQLLGSCNQPLAGIHVTNPWVC